jgi:DNA-directed RNA polymerase specialized sigma24 family protein
LINVLDGIEEHFEANRTHLRAVAYRMLGSQGEADDAVQESWLHLSRSGTSGVENLGGWLTTVVARGWPEKFSPAEKNPSHPGAISTGSLRPPPCPS